MLLTSRSGESTQCEHYLWRFSRRHRDRNDAGGSLHPRKSPDQVDLASAVHADLFCSGGPEVGPDPFPRHLLLSWLPAFLHSPERRRSSSCREADQAEETGEP